MKKFFIQSNKTYPSNISWQYFLDGNRIIDCILVYEAKNSDEEVLLNQKNVTSAEKELLSMRQLFRKALTDEGLNLEECDSESFTSIHFIKVHVPLSVMMLHAEAMEMRVPLNVRREDEEVNYHLPKFYDYIPSFFTKFLIDVQAKAQNEESKGKIRSHYLTRLYISRLEKYALPYYGDMFFQPAQRNTIMLYLLQKCTIKHIENNKEVDLVGIDSLTDLGAFTSFFPIHCDPIYRRDSSDGRILCLTSRQYLAKHWGSLSNWTKLFQPLYCIYLYFGAKTAFYFAFAGFYIQYLTIPAVIGCGYLTNSLIKFWSDPVASQICNYKPDYHLCNFQEKVDDSCIMAYMNAFFSQPANAAYAFIICVWGFWFTEKWKQKESELRYEWDLWQDTFNLNTNNDVELPNYKRWIRKFPNTKRFNYRTQEFENCLPNYLIWMRNCVSFVGLASVFVLTLIMLLYSIMIRNIALTWFDLPPRISSFLGISFSVLCQLCVNVVMGYIYEILALFFTNFQIHRRSQQFEDSFVYKMYIFKFMTSYCSILYYTFAGNEIVHQSFTQYWGTTCRLPDCLGNVGYSVLTFMIGLPVINMSLQLIDSSFKSYMQKYKTLRRENRYQSKLKTGNLRRLLSVSNEMNSLRLPQWERDYFLEEIDTQVVFSEYIEFFIQFGYITIFAFSSPFAPICAFIANLFEVRLDATKFMKMRKRPWCVRAISIGAWRNILAVIMHIAVLVNAYLIAFTSTYIDKMAFKTRNNESLANFLDSFLIIKGEKNEKCIDIRRYQTPNNKKDDDYYWYVMTWRLLFVIIFQQLVIICKNLIINIVDKISPNIKKKMKKELKFHRQFLFDETEKRRFDSRQSYLSR